MVSASGVLGAGAPALAQGLSPCLSRLSDGVLAAQGHCLLWPCGCERMAVAEPGAR